ncbi:ABC transporter ATP-binding protein [Streptomyces mirabilis]
MGSNGSGKSTLLRTVYRSLRPADGVARVGGDDVGELSARTAARRTAAVLQDAGTTIGLSVTEIVALGRTPHHALTGRGGAEDREAVAEAVARCGVGPFADRDHATLSGGEEHQRVLPARTLVQRPRLLVLDELTNHLGIRARFELLELIRSTGITTLAVLRDLDLAARLRDHLVVLHEDVVVAAGPVLEVLTRDLPRDVFGVRGSTERHADGVVRITCAAQPLAADEEVEPEPAER